MLSLLYVGGGLFPYQPTTNRPHAGQVQQCLLQPIALCYRYFRRITNRRKTMDYISALFWGFFLPLLAFAALSAIATLLEYFTVNK